MQQGAVNMWRYILDTKRLYSTADEAVPTAFDNGLLSRWC